jgi:hypothetical protein
LAELAFDLDEKGDHSCLRSAVGRSGNPANTAAGGKGRAERRGLMAFAVDVLAGVIPHHRRGDDAAGDRRPK